MKIQVRDEEGNLIERELTQEELIAYEEQEKGLNYGAI